MSNVEKLYKKENYRIKKAINIEEGLYSRLKDVVENDYDTNYSKIINVCIERLLQQKEIKFYYKPEGETLAVRTFMIRKENKEGLEEIRHKRGIPVSRLINTAIKEFLDEHDKEKNK